MAAACWQILPDEVHYRLFAIRNESRRTLTTFYVCMGPNSLRRIPYRLLNVCALLPCNGASISIQCILRRFLPSEIARSQ